MCDYSLHLVTSRPAKIADKLVTTKFDHSTTRGFAAIGEPNVAVCLQSGTKIAFVSDVESYNGYLNAWGNRKLSQRVARFRQVKRDEPNTHHDALEFPDGQVVMVTTQLCEGLRLRLMKRASGSKTLSLRNPIVSSGAALVT